MSVTADGHRWKRRDVSGLPVLLWETNQLLNGPAILFLHGVGERGVDGGSALRYGLPSVVPSTATAHARVVVPQCPPGSRWTDHLDDLARVVEATGAPATVAGFSMGGEGVWAFAAAHPTFVARLAPVAARLPSGIAAGELAGSLPDLPTWVVHGAEDERVAVTESDAIVEALTARGRPPRYARFEGLGHVASCERAYGDEAYLRWLSGAP